MIEYKQIIVPLALFIFIAIVLIILINLLFNYLNRRLALETIKVALSKNQTVNPELIKTIINEKSDQQSDYRTGCLLGAATLATMILSFIVYILGHKTISIALLGMAFLPGLLSMTYLLFHFKTTEKK